MTFSQSALLAVSGSTAVSILVKVTATTALALAGSRLARRRAASHRHLVLASAFGLLVLIPLASIVAPPLVVPVRVRIPSPPDDRSRRPTRTNSSGWRAASRPVPRTRS